MIKYFKLPPKLILAIIFYWLIFTITNVITLYFNPDYSSITSEWPLEMWMKRLLLMLWSIVSTYFVFIWYKNRTITVSNWKISLFQLTLAGVVWVLLFEAYHTLIQIAVLKYKGDFIDLYFKNITVYTVYTYFSLFSVVVVANAYYYYLSMMQEKNESIELQLKLANTELMLYRAQLEPHFLFNSLNSISSLIRLDRGHQATEAINNLSTLLRSIVEVGNTHMMPLKWELEFTSHYIALQKLRFTEKLNVKITADEISSKELFPVMIIQPLIENAIVHGKLADSKQTNVTVNITSDGELIILRASNLVGKKRNGNGAGFGLKNMRYRLTALFNDRFEMNASQSDNTFVVHIQFPIQKESSNWIAKC